MAVLFGLTGFVVAQPVLDLLGRSLSTWRGRGFAGWNIALFVAALLIVPPMLMWLFDVVVHRFAGRGAGRAVHLGSVALLIAGAGFLVAKAVGVGGLAAVAGVGLVVGGLAFAAYLRSAFMQRWLSFLAVVPLAVGAGFFLSSVGETLTAPEQVAAEVDFAEPPPSIVYLILDELPTRSMLDSEGRIDAVRYPNIAELAGQSTWYRTATSVSPFTRTAVPSMLTGNEPEGEPLWTDHPENLFSLLAGSHHLTVSESLTKLCGFAVCSGSVPLAPPVDGEVPEPPELKAEWGSMVSEAFRLWRARVLPADRTEVGLDEFEEERVSGESLPPNGAVVELDEEANAYDRFFRIQADAQPLRHVDFVDAIGPSSDPGLFFLHLVLPHQPWTYLEDGTLYAIPERMNILPTTDWLMSVHRQRHLAQASYSDRLVGLIMNKLKESDQFDDAMVVLTADHGVSFLPGQNQRVVLEETLPDVAFVPMLIKLPGQIEGEVSDANATTVDIVPTIADVLGVELPWDADGVSLLGDEPDDRGDTRLIYDYESAQSTSSRGIIEFSLDDEWQRVVEGLAPPLGRTDDAVSPLYQSSRGAELVGLDPDDAFGGNGPSADAPMLEVDVLSALAEPPTATAPYGMVTGLVPEEQRESFGDDAVVVVAANDEVIAVSPMARAPLQDGTFATLLPTRLVGKPLNLRIARLDADGTITEYQLGEL